MQQLSGLDASFLALDTGTSYGHVGSICVLDPSSAAEPLTLERLTDLIRSRLHLVPLFRRRLAEVPLGIDQPYWIDDPDFDLEYHVREIALPAPGDDRQLADQAARLHARPVDRTRPLWEAYLISGLSGGRQAMYMKIHHAAIDGVSGTELMTVLLDDDPAGREVPPAPEWNPDRPPATLDLLGRGLLSLVGHPVRAARIGVALAQSAPSMVTAPALRPRVPVLDRLLRRDDNPVLAQTPLRAPQTPFNRPITPHRKWAFRSLPLEEVKRIKNAHGVTLNDVVMTLTAGALRRWLADHDALPSGPLVAAVPVSIRTKETQGAYGNQVSAMIAPLPTHLEDPGERLQFAHEAMRGAKEQHNALPAHLITDLSRFAMPAISAQAARLNARLRLIERLSPYNVLVSNVPGPRTPLYLGGVALLHYYPLSAIADGQGLNITVHSYVDTLDFGLLACRELVPDLDDMAGYLESELGVLGAAQVPQAS